MKDILGCLLVAAVASHLVPGQQPVPVIEFQRQLSDLGSKLTFLDARQSSCARELASQAAKVTQETAASDVCTAKDAELCRAAFDKQLRDEAASQEQSCRSTIEKTVRANQPDWRDDAIKAEVTKQFDAAHKGPIGKVDDEFRKTDRGAAT